MNKQYFSSDFNPANACKVAEGLNVYLANLNILYSKLHNFHWNVVGAGFFGLHAKTQELYEKMATELDIVAERIKALEYMPLASMHEYLQAATISDISSKPFTTEEVTQMIINDFSCIVRLLRKIEAFAKKASDECTIGLITEAICYFEKQIWLMNASLEPC
ncbi:MAG: Ferritin Dps family protein [Firmicutes bacterium]|nr:Ferritin Dps family protein [Bacillota bacterium]